MPKVKIEIEAEEAVYLRCFLPRNPKRMRHPNPDAKSAVAKVVDQLERQGAMLDGWKGGA